MKRIICIGNRYLPEDAAAILVYEALISMELPAGVEVVDGGLAGLDLLYLVEGMERVVFVDAVSGFGVHGSVSLLNKNEVTALADQCFGHSSGLPYLLKVMPEVCQGILPQVKILGIEGIPNLKTVEMASSLALRVVTGDATEEEGFYE